MHTQTGPKNMSTKHSSTGSTATASTQISSETSPRTHLLYYHSKLMWITMGTVLGGVALLSCLILTFICAAVTAVSVQRHKEGQDHPLLLRYDRVPPSDTSGDEEEEEERVENVYETMTLLDHPPTYQELDRIKEKADLGFSP